MPPTLSFLSWEKQKRDFVYRVFRRISFEDDGRVLQHFGEARGLFLPVGLDENRPDVVIANPDGFREIIQTYKQDPCKRLIRRESDGEFILDPSLFGPEAKITINSVTVESCKAKYGGKKKTKKVSKGSKGA